MNQIVPPSFLFRWSFVARRLDNIPRAGGRLLDLPQECVLTSLSELDQSKSFAVVKVAWNDSGLGFSARISGKTERPKCDSHQPDTGDRIQLWINTRNSQTIHRPTKFCHRFVLLPTGGGPKRTGAFVKSQPIAISNESLASPNVEKVRLHAEVSSTGYELEAWFPVEVFTGFDPSNHSRLGLHYLIHDHELGTQALASVSDFRFETDPSLWQTVELSS